MLDIPNVLNDKAEPKFLSGQATVQTGLYFLGYVYSHHRNLFESDIASQKLANAVSGYLNHVI